MATLLYSNEILIEVAVDSLQLQYQTGVALLKWNGVLLTVRFLHISHIVWHTLALRMRHF